jgi:hypothetical protein
MLAREEERDLSLRGSEFKLLATKLFAKSPSMPHIAETSHREFAR